MSSVIGTDHSAVPRAAGLHILFGHYESSHAMSPTSTPHAGHVGLSAISTNQDLCVRPENKKSRFQSQSGFYHLLFIILAKYSIRHASRRAEDEHSSSSILYMVVLRCRSPK